MSKMEQVLIMEPQHELKFVGTFTYPITSYIKLTNPTNKKVGFKIKTTAPKKYCVRPNSGILEPSATTDIAVSLQTHDFDQSEKNKHKFMVQTMFVPDGEVNLESLWKEVNEDQVMGTKLKCVFERKEAAAAAAGPLAEEFSKAPPAESVQASREEKNWPRRMGDSPSVHDDGELQKAAKEVKHLREEESSLRQENLQLKEEVLRLRLLCNQADSQSAMSRSSVTAPPPTAMPMMVVIAIVVGMVGIVLGKFIL